MAAVAGRRNRSPAPHAFCSGHRRFRLIVDQHGFILQRSALDTGAAPAPASPVAGG